MTHSSLRAAGMGMAAAASIVAFTASATAAMLTDTSGKVFLNRGEGFQPVSGSVKLHPGDKVMVTPNSSASVFFAADCTASIEPGTVYHVGATNGCPTTDGDGHARDAQDGLDAWQDQAAIISRRGHTPADGVLHRADTLAGSTGISSTVMVVGGVAIIGGVVAAIASNNDDDDNAPVRRRSPASP